MQYHNQIDQAFVSFPRMKQKLRNKKNLNESSILDLKNQTLSL